MERTLNLLPPELSGALLYPLDRPARAALDLGRAPLSRTAALGAAGLGLWAVSSVLANGLLGAWHSFDALGGALEALAVAFPGLLVFAAYLRVSVPSRALLAAQAVALWTCGVVSACLLPLLAFLAAASHGQLFALHLRGLLVPVVGLGVASAVLLRVLRTFDARPRTRLLSHAFVAMVSVAFLVKLQMSFPYLLDLARSAR